ncbi:unnamed protein product, partial [marine sediment metagenome]
MWIYEGNVPTWVDDLNIDLGDCDCRPILQFSDKITLTIIGNLKTYGDAELYGNASGPFKCVFNTADKTWEHYNDYLVV